MRQSTLLIIAIPCIVSLLLFAARNFSGEVATLYTTDAGGRTYQSEVWVVDQRHSTWIRSARPDSPWLDRVINQPEVQLKRGKIMKTFRAEPRTNRRAEINALMAQTYGWADWLLDKVEDRDQSVPVYLDPFG